MQTIKLNQIQPYALQPPGRARDTTDLQESHRQVGILRPPIIVPYRYYPKSEGPQYVCLAGWRTITAAKAMGLAEMACIVRDDLVDDPDKQTAVFAQSNLHKELTSLERAEIVKSMVDQGKPFAEAAKAFAKAARIMGVSRTEIKHLLNLANAPDEVKELVSRGGRGRDGLSYSTFKVELSSLPSEQMIERLTEAGDLSRRSLKRARQKAAGNMTERMMDSTDDILKVIQVVRHSLAQVEVFLRTATPEAKDEVRVALGPVLELWEEVRNDNDSCGSN